MVSQVIISKMQTTGNCIGQKTWVIQQVIFSLQGERKKTFKGNLPTKTLKGYLSYLQCMGLIWVELC